MEFILISLLGLPIITDLKRFMKSSVERTWEEQQNITREIMIYDIMKSIQIDREKQIKDPFLEPFNFEALVNSSKKTIWLSKEERKLLCAEAWFRLLDKKDYRYGNKQLFLETVNFDF